MHARGIEVDEPRPILLGLAVDEVDSGSEKLLVHRFHTLGVESAGILDDLLADLAVGWINGRIVLIARFCLEHAPWAKLGAEARVFRIIYVLRLFLGVEVIEIAEELIEAVHRRQELVAIA